MRDVLALFALAAMVTGPLVAPDAQTSSVAPSASCESLAKIALPYATITSAEAVAAGFTPPGGRGGRGRGGAPAAPLPPFCRVTVTLTPTPQSDIKVEVWLPLEWNGRLLEVGNGGWAGSINYGGLSTALSAGFATASTDTGHTGGSPSFAIERPEAVIDYGYRAVHEMTLKAKQLISSFYGRAIQFSYYNSVLKAVPDTGLNASSMRLFSAPGMAHCGGGDGPDTFDRIGAIRAWVENGTAPDRLVATKGSGGQTTRSRPLCPYPQVARWSGTGSIDEAANFSCVSPPAAPSAR